MPENSSRSTQEHIRWPAWLLSSGPDAVFSLQTFDAVAQRCREASKSGYTYRYVLNEAVNAIIDPHLKQGPIGPAFLGSLSTRDKATTIVQNGNAYRVLGTLGLQGLRAIWEAADLMRSVFRECVGHPREEGESEVDWNARTGMRRVLKPGGRIVAIVYSTPDANQFFSIPVS